MRVSLDQHHGRARPSGAAAGPRPLLDTRGARVVLGGPAGTAALAAPISPAADTLFGPRGACLAGPDGPLIVCDTGHHRLLIWTGIPDRDNAPADLLIGQKDFTAEGRNGKGEIGPATLNVPTGIATGDGVLAVADPWNHRVLLWHGLPRRSHQAADVVLGQADPLSGHANRGLGMARADTLNWCYGVSIVGRRLLVSDTGNRRVLVWNRIPTRNGMPADLVLGQRDFTTRDENAGADGSAVGMRWPHGIAAIEDRLFVADAGNNRIMAWNSFPERNGAACNLVLGQSDLTSLDHNRGGYDPTAATMNMPYGLAAHGASLVIADTANSRLLGFDASRLAMGTPAVNLAGQNGFEDKGDNRWTAPSRDSLCWPYSVAVCGTTFAIADSGNNRILLWEAAG